MLPAASDFFFVWDAAAKTFDKVALGAHAQQQDLRVVCWSADSTKCAIGASKGAMLLFDVSIRKILHNVQGVHDRVRTAHANPDTCCPAEGFAGTPCLDVHGCVSATMLSAAPRALHLLYRRLVQPQAFESIHGRDAGRRVRRDGRRHRGDRG